MLGREHDELHPALGGRGLVPAGADRLPARGRFLELPILMGPVASEPAIGHEGGTICLDPAAELDARRGTGGAHDPWMGVEVYAFDRALHPLLLRLIRVVLRLD